MSLQEEEMSDWDEESALNGIIRAIFDDVLIVPLQETDTLRKIIRTPASDLDRSKRILNLEYSPALL